MDVLTNDAPASQDSGIAAVADAPVDQGIATAGGEGGNNDAPASKTEPGEGERWSEFDLDSILQYDPFADKGTGDEGKAPATSPRGEDRKALNTPPVEVPTVAPQAAPQALPGELETQMLRAQVQQLQAMISQQQNHNQAPAQDQYADTELDQLYQVPASYGNMQIPAELLQAITSGEPAQVAQGLNQFAQGLANVIHGQVAQQAKQREAMIAQRTEARATAPFKAQQEQTQAKQFHDNFYATHKELDKQHLKPYIAMKISQLAKQVGITDPTPEFLNWAAAQVKTELQIQTPSAPAAHVVPPALKPTAPFMSGSPGARAPSSAPASQDDIFSTLFG